MPLAGTLSLIVASEGSSRSQGIVSGLKVEHAKVITNTGIPRQVNLSQNFVPARIQIYYKILYNLG